LLDREVVSGYNNGVEAVEAALEEFFKRHPEFLRICQGFRWGRIEITVKDGKPVMISVKKDIKLE